MGISQLQFSESTNVVSRCDGSVVFGRTYTRSTRSRGMCWFSQCRKVATGKGEPIKSWLSIPTIQMATKRNRPA
jgi:hypothetical protein